jgi:hypothetical protein
MAVFGVVPAFVPLKFVASLRPGDQGLSLRLSDLEQSSLGAVEGGVLELWGVPADHQEGTAIPRRPMLTMPTRCDSGPVWTRISMRTWEQPDVWHSDRSDTGQPLNGCAELPFDPGLTIALANPAPDVPTGARFDISVPQHEAPEGRVASQLKDVHLLLPEGVAISPGAVAGLSTCSDAQLGLGTAAAATCPPASRIGSVELIAAPLARPMISTIYLGQGTPSERLRMFVVASGAGNTMKFVGALRSDPSTGRLSARLTELPQMSFASMSLRFDGGPRALLVTPMTCGPATAAATFTPYKGGGPVFTQATTTIGAADGRCGAAAAFAPSFSAGTTRFEAGASAAFTATISRRDGEQLLERMELVFPPGLAASLGSVDLCPSAALATGTCPAASRIGSAIGELGPGAQPALLGSDAFLTGPYRKAPYGLALIFKARLGPFDMGTLVVRGTLRIDPGTGQVKVATDPFPRSIEGVALRFQRIGLDIDRPGFMRNPTSCAPSEAGANLRSVNGALAHAATPFRARNCVGLPFKPAFALSLTGKDDLHAGGKPGLRITARLRKKDAGLRQAEINLPRALELDFSGLREICARKAAKEGDCPKGSRVGRGLASTPLLEEPMRGSIFVAQPQRGNGPPDLWMSLAGGGLHVAMRAETATVKGRVVTRLVELLDFPLAKLTMGFAGGERGALRLRRDPCRGRLSSSLALEGQNRALREVRVGVGVDCGRTGSGSPKG